MVLATVLRYFCADVKSSALLYRVGFVMFLRLRLSSYYFALFIMIGTYVPYLPVWLTGKGLTGEEIGLVLAVALWMKIPVSIIATSLSDAWGRRKALICLLSLTIVIGLLTFYHLEGVFALAVGWGLVGALMTAAIPLGDNMSFLAIKRHDLDFGRLRLWGSISFILASLIGGAYLNQGDVSGNAVLHLLVGGSVLFCGIAFFLPSFQTPSQKVQTLGFLAPFRIPSFWVFLLSAAPILASHAALYGFATVHWQTLGIPDFFIGLLWAEGVIAEVLIFIYGKKILQRTSPALLLAVAASAATVRWGIIGTTESLVVLVFAQVLHALSFALTYVAAQAYMIRTIPDDISAAAQGAYDAIAMGLIFGVAMTVSGWAYEGYGGMTFYSMVPFSLGAGLFALFGLRKFEK